MEVVVVVTDEFSVVYFRHICVFYVNGALLCPGATPCVEYLIRKVSIITNIN